MSTLKLPRVGPAEGGLDPAAVATFLEAVRVNPDVELHSLMILRHGAVLAEGWWHPYRPDELHLLHSLSKSFTSTAAGMAIEEGLLDLDTPVVEVFDDLAGSAADDRVRAITIRNCLQMATGHREDTLWRAREADPDDLVRGFLTVPPDEDPGRLFCYNNGASFVAGAAVQRVTGKTLTDYLRPRLFRPLGIDHLYWQTDERGRDLGFTGLHLTTEAVASFGQLLLHQGGLQDRQLINADWIRQATSLQTDNSNQTNPDWRQGYGFQFWLARHGFRGDGAFGQFCLVLPELDAVIAITGASADLQAVLNAVWDQLLPGFSDDSGGAGDSSSGVDDSSSGVDNDALAGRLRDLTLSPAGGPQHRPGPIPRPEPDDVGAVDPVRVVSVTEVGDDQLEIAIEHDRTGELSGEPLRYRAGIGHWAYGDHQLSDRLLRCAGSAARHPDGTVEVELIFVQTAHRLRLRRHPDGRTESGWVTQPHTGPYPELLATRIRSDR